MKNKRFIDSLKNACAGIVHTLKSERNFKFHVLAAVVTIAAAIIYKFNSVKFILLITTIAIVFISELFNTAIETVVDMVCKEEYNPLAKIAKDVAAGAVLAAVLCAVAVGLFLFLY